MNFSKRDGIGPLKIQWVAAFLGKKKKLAHDLLHTKLKAAA
jgi:hypothetical protein